MHLAPGAATRPYRTALWAGMLVYAATVSANVAGYSKLATLMLDASFGSIAPKIAKHFIGAEIRNFPYVERDAAMAWILG